MKIKFLLLALALFLACPQTIHAQTEEGIKSFKQENNSLRQNEKKDEPQITPKMKDTIPAAALKNILEAEQAFCYTVETPEEDYKGYTLDGFALTGFCGILPKVEMNIFIEEYLSKDENISSLVEQCIIQPRIMLRFIRGVDYADILYSSPCHSFTVLYGGNIISFNASPSSGIMDAIINAYEKNKRPFISPALIGQVLPIGVPQNDSQKALVHEKTSEKPVRNWVKKETPETTETPVEKPAKKGWNNLKLN